MGDWFRTTVGVRQGCLLSPTLFNIFLESIMTDALEDNEGTVSIGGRTITDLHFADDIDAGEEEELAKCPCQDPAGNRTTRRPPDHYKETQTAVEWSCILFSRSGQTHLARHSERVKKTRQTEEDVGRQHQGMDRPGVCQVSEGNAKNREKLRNHLWCPNDPHG